MSPAVALLLLLAGCYAGVRISRLGNWYTLAGLYRFAAMWALLVLLGYGAPLYTLPGLAVVGVLWSMLRRKVWLQIVLELLTFAALIELSGMPLRPEYLVLALTFDQVCSRLALLRFDPRRAVRVGMHRLVTALGSLCGGALLGYLCLPDATLYLQRHNLHEMLQLAPKGLPAPWLRHHQLLEGSYYEARFPESADRCALFFHGAAPQASLQSTALSVQQSLLARGIRVYAVDHPGFGQSPPPATVTDIDAWDPARLTSAVIHRMTLAGCRKNFAIGHSQGVTEALRLLTLENAEFAGFVVLGAGLYENTEASRRYWFERFHIDRKLTDRLDYDSWLSIRDRYYRNEDYCAATASGRQRPDGARLAYVVFRQEHENLKRTREQLWECLQYPNAERMAFDSGHYLNSAQLGPFVFISLENVERFGERVLGPML